MPLPILITGDGGTRSLEAEIYNPDQWTECEADLMRYAGVSRPGPRLDPTIAAAVVLGDGGPGDGGDAQYVG